MGLGVCTWSAMVAAQATPTTAVPTTAQVTLPVPPVPRFVEETDNAGLQSRFEGEGEYMVGGGVAAFDCDADGLPDLYITAGVNKAKF